MFDELHTNQLQKSKKKGISFARACVCICVCVCGEGMVWGYFYITAKKIIFSQQKYFILK